MGELAAFDNVTEKDGVVSDDGVIANRGERWVQQSAGAVDEYGGEDGRTASEAIADEAEADAADRGHQE